MGEATWAKVSVDFFRHPRTRRLSKDGQLLFLASILHCKEFGTDGRFPADEAWHGADSADLLGHTAALVRDAGWKPTQVDLVIVAAGPAIAPRRSEMAARIAALLGIGPGDVSVKGTTSDGLGLAGGEGIAACAVATLAPA